MIRYIKLWALMALYTSQVSFQSRFGAVFFLFGKILRFGLFLIFLLAISGKVQKVSGFSLWEMILFYATFNLIDTFAQLVLREVYRFRSYVVSGDFDYFLVKPVSPLFRSLFGGSDILDLPVLLFSVFFIVFSALKIPTISWSGIVSFFILIIIAHLIALSFHIFVLAMGILTTEVDNTLWLYRDLTQMGRIPVDVYREPIRTFITFFIPIGVMITFPAKALIGILSFQFILISAIIGFTLLFLTSKFWKFALEKYSSASS